MSLTLTQSLRKRAKEERSGTLPAQPKVHAIAGTNGGPGTELAKILKWWGFDLEAADKAAGCNSCRFHAYHMDRMGPAVCRSQLPTIRAWLQTALDKSQADGQCSTLFAFLATNGGIDVLIRLAIRRAESMGNNSRVYLLGYPGKMGGANTEAYHLLKLWKKFGMEVHLIPTWNCAEEDERHLTDLGFITHRVQPHTLHTVPGLSGGITVGMCNVHYCNSLGQLRTMGCKTVWINCMTFIFQHERHAFAQWGMPDALVYQSQHQQRLLTQAFQPYERFPTPNYLIHGAFDVGDYPFSYSSRKDPEGEPFVVGKLARPDADKWPQNLWEIFGNIQHPHRTALVMGCRAETYLKIRTPPPWATCLAPMEISSQDFLKRVHCCVAPNGGAGENWSRIGLECMSSGVPLVVPHSWGWPEMIRHGETGFLANDDAELSKYTTQLAHDEPLRERIAKAARHDLETNLADPHSQWMQWQHLFHDLYAKDELPPSTPG
jgi:hypothetical protein